jgi:hypothetical protein
MPKGQNKNLIIHKKNNRGCVAVLRLDDFIALLKELNHDKNSCDGKL